MLNGSTWDRVRGNYNTNTGDTGAKTATFNGATQTNYNARGAKILFNIGTVSGTTPTLVAKLHLTWLKLLILKVVSWVTCGFVGEIGEAGALS